jgi:filamentous hemagglutinin family protein
MTVNASSARAFILRFVLSVAGLAVMELDAIGQVVPDNTLSNPSLVNTSGSTATINGGTTAGTNLFHSFSQFSVPSGSTAFFSNNLAIDNIIARVTGGSFSFINGRIRANGTANLFLINPSGIIFGPNVSLNIGGSFVASSANSFTFADGLRYSAENPQAAPLLAVNVPIGLQYGKMAGPVAAISSFLSVRPGKTLALAGGDVFLSNTFLTSSGGRIELGGLSDSGTVGLIFSRNIPSLNFSAEDATRSNASLTGGFLSVSGSGGGDIVVQAQNIDISDALLLAGLSSGKGIQGGNITLTASDRLTVVNSVIYNLVNSQANGNGGNIDIAAKSLTLTNSTKIGTGLFGKGSAGSVNIVADSLSLTKGAQLQTDNDGIGNAGDINVFVSDTVTLNGIDDQGIFSAILSSVEENAQGNGGNISISAKSINLASEALIGSATNGKGNAGNLTIAAKDLVVLDSETSFVVSGSNSTASGNAGNISIFTEALKLNNGASVINATLGQGNAGNISIAATDTINLDGAGTNGIGSLIDILTGDKSSGNGGDINISTRGLSLTNGGLIGSGSQGTGITGDIVISASDFIRLDGVGPLLVGGIFNNPAIGGEGGAGSIIIDTKSLRLSDGATIFALQTGSQKTGNIDITATESVDILGAKGPEYPSRIASATLSDLPSGDITINTPVLNIVGQGLGGLDQTGVTATSRGPGNAGDIAINARTVTVDGGEIAAIMEDKAIGDGGSITIKANTLKAVNGGNVKTSTISTNGGNAGDIIFFLSDMLNLSGNGSGVFANTGSNSTGNGGSIFIDPLTVTIADGAAISVDSQGSGTGGSISLQAKSLTLDNGTISAATASNNGGNINLDVQGLLLANNNGTVSATAGGNGNGGNLDINAGFIVLNNNSDIAANALQGRGGNIQIATQGLFQSRDSTITASSQLGINGIVQLNVTDLDPSRGLFRLPETVVDASGLVSQKCDATVGKEPLQSEFVVTGKGGFRPNPSESLQDESILSNWATLQPHFGQSSKQSSAMIAPPAQKSDVIAMAQGWKVDSDGTVVLTAEPSSATAPPTWQPSAKCRA